MRPFQAYNRNKRSIALDLKRRKTRGLFDSLVHEADYSFRTQAGDRQHVLGAGSERLTGSISRLIYTSISGFARAVLTRTVRATIRSPQALSGFLSVVVDSQPSALLGSRSRGRDTGISRPTASGALVQRGGPAKAHG